MRTPCELRGLCRASLRTADGWRTVREPRESYATASMLEWGSITKGLVGTTARLALEVDRPVVHYLPGVPDVEMTVADLVHHASGLSRLPATMRDRLFRDPYREAVGIPLDHAVAVPVAPRGRFVYSNLGYALLGAVLDEVHGDWFDAVRQHVLEPAGMSSAALVPAPADRVVPKLFGRAIKPWALGGSSLRRQASSGLHSTISVATPIGRLSQAPERPAP
ncbi:serine hydrolase domain-containing protein [Curtobacterium sp. NPDC089991]|uniref:serine hydrolase domain-containing protein n=1 Tax=Curtobacterium sp. NPDC089991 TaxID=3363969 RepID=UPI00381057B5